MSEQITKYKKIDEYIESIQLDLKGLQDSKKSAILEVISAIQKTKANNKTIFVFGNGGSSSTASHFACDLIKFIKVKVMCLSDNVPSVLAIANDVSYEHIFIDQLKVFMEEGDVVIGFSGSGKSKNVVRALSYAKEMGTSIAITGFDGGLLPIDVDICLIVPSDNMQQIEDIHLMITHIIMTIIRGK